MLRWVLLALLLTLGCAASAAFGVRAADTVGRHIAGNLVALSSLAQKVPLAPSADEEDDDEEVAFETPVAIAPAPAQGLRKPPPRKRGSPKAAAAAPCAVFVPAATVLRLAESRARPRGVRIAASAQRPAGLRLSNVTRLGIGVLDGDVLTHAAGQPALDASAVIQAVLVARSRRAATISGVFYRGAERCTLTVEQPYPHP